MFLLASVPARATAQIVNVQGALAKPPEKDGATGQLELKVDWREGNLPLFDIGATSSLLVRRGRVVGLAIARGEYGASGGLTFKRRTFEHVRVRATLDCRWRWEAFAQHELDGIRRLAVRALTGTGPALQVVNTKNVSLLAGASYLFEYEQFDRRTGASDAGQREIAHRASLYVTGQQKIGDSAAFIETLYVQPRIDEPRDLRLLGELTVTKKLSKRIALTDGLVIAYDHTPPEGVKRYDLQLRIGVLITF